jgi:hypothetical protein
VLLDASYSPLSTGHAAGSGHLLVQVGILPHPSQISLPSTKGLSIRAKSPLLPEGRRESAGFCGQSALILRLAATLSPLVGVPVYASKYCTLQWMRVSPPLYSHLLPKIIGEFEGDISGTAPNSSSVPR